MNKYYKLVSNDLKSCCVPRHIPKVQYEVDQTSVPLDGWDPDVDACGPGGLYFCDEEQFKKGIQWGARKLHFTKVLEVEPRAFSEEEPRIVFGEDTNKAYQLHVISATPLGLFLEQHLDWVDEYPEMFVFLREELQTGERYLAYLNLKAKNPPLFLTFLAILLAPEIEKMENENRKELN
jgi:hypothetical protein